MAQPLVALGVQPVHVPDQMQGLGKLLTLQNLAQENALRRAQMDKYQQGQAQQVQLMQALEQWVGTLPPEKQQMARLALMTDPDGFSKAFAAQMFPQHQPLMKVAPDESVLDPNTRTEVYRAPAKTVADKGVWSDPYQMGGATVQRNSVTGEIRQAVGRPPVTHITTGEQGKPPAGYRWKGDGQLEAIPGGPADKPPAARPIPFAEKQELTMFSDNVRSLKQLQASFKDEYAGKGGAGGAIVATEQALGSWAPKDSQDRAQWWSNFQTLVELPQRHALFGAALTLTEKQAWDRARNIKPGAHPNVVRQAMNQLLGIYQTKMNAFSSALKEEGKSPEAVEALSAPSRGSSGSWSIERAQ